MPTPAVTLKLKRFRRRFGIAAPRVRVRTHFDWHWYAIAVGFFVLVVAGIGWWVAQRGEALQMGDEVRLLRQRLQEMEGELLQLRASSGTEQNVVRMERTTQQQLTARLRLLEQENAGLKEDIGLFERLVPAEGVESSLRIDRLSVVSAAEPGRYRYRLLLGFLPSKSDREFRGRLQLVVTTVQGGREVLLDLHAGKESSPDFVVEIRNFLRKEGGFSLPVGAKIKSIEARLVQGAIVKARLVTNY